MKAQHLIIRFDVTPHPDFFRNREHHGPHSSCALRIIERCLPAKKMSGAAGSLPNSAPLVVCVSGLLWLVDNAPARVHADCMTHSLLRTSSKPIGATHAWHLGRIFRRKTQDQPGVGPSHTLGGSSKHFLTVNMNSTHGFGSSAERAARADEQSCVSFSRRKQ